MNKANFAKYLTGFLSTYLSGQKNVSKNTIYAYRDTFNTDFYYKQNRQNKHLIIPQVA